MGNLKLAGSFINSPKLFQYSTFHSERRDGENRIELESLNPHDDQSEMVILI